MREYEQRTRQLDPAEFTLVFQDADEELPEREQVVAGEPG
jgi:hypothetical protein